MPAVTAQSDVLLTGSVAVLTGVHVNETYLKLIEILSHDKRRQEITRESAAHAPGHSSKIVGVLNE